MCDSRLLKTALLFIALFWNLENFFDPFDDKQSSGDNDFTPKGKYFWSWKKFAKKRDDIAKIIISIGDHYRILPSFVAVSEAENRFVLNQLINETPLARLNYGVIHKESPDKRGIDVGLLYRKEYFEPIKINYYSLDFPTRLILYVKGFSSDINDTLHVIVNHWPSKIGSKNQTHKKRITVSNIVKRITDSLFNYDNNVKIVVMGDFNDSPLSEPVRNLDILKNLAEDIIKKDRTAGTNKYKEKWSLIDQILVSPCIYNNVYMEIYSKNLLIKDNTYLGLKPYRTLIGPRYQGGISDHLPVVLVWNKIRLQKH